MSVCDWLLSPRRPQREIITIRNMMKYKLSVLISISAGIIFIYYLFTLYATNRTVRIRCSSDPYYGIDTSPYTQRQLNNHIRPSPDTIMHYRTLIIYAYSPGQHRDANLEYFIRKGGIISDEQYQFVMVGNGVKWSQTKYAKMIKQFDNVDFIERENFGFDSCAWKSTLDKYNDSLKGLKGKEVFKRFILLNASVRGPFLPVYASSVPWPEIFLSPLMSSPPSGVTTKDVGVKGGVAGVKDDGDNLMGGLSGTTVNCWFGHKGLHIQSMLLAFTKHSLPVVMQTLLCVDDKQKVIDQVEVGLSQAILRNGSNLYSTMKYWAGHDFRDVAMTERKCRGIPSDLYSGPTDYFGMSLHPLEVVFVKTNRHVPPVQIDCYSQWSSPIV